MSYGVTIFPDSARTQQTVAFHIYTQDVPAGRASWSNWQVGITSTLPGTPYRYWNILQAPEGLQKIYVEYAWLTSAGWRYKGEWISRYQQTGLYNGVWNGYFTHCDL